MSDAFWLSARMKSPPSLWQPVSFLGYSHSKKLFLHIQIFLSYLLYFLQRHLHFLRTEACFLLQIEIKANIDMKWQIDGWRNDQIESSLQTLPSCTLVTQRRDVPFSGSSHKSSPHKTQENSLHFTPCLPFPAPRLCRAGLARSFLGVSWPL